MRRRFIAALAFTLATPLVGARSGAADLWQGVPALMYHKVDAYVPSDAVGKDLTVAPADFERQVAYLESHRIRTFTAEQLVAALRRGERPRGAVVLTFDDGYEDAATVVAPALARHHAVGTFYISAGFVGTPGHVTWRELRAMRALGMEVACHGTFHRDLTTLSAAERRFEIEHCLRTFGRYLGYRPTTYAYPAGAYDAAAIADVRANGFAVAFTEHPGLVRDLHDPYELPRRRIHRTDPLEAFAALAVP